jgi:hypothetical protein
MRLALVLHLLLAVALATSRAQAAPPDVASPLVASPIASPDPVLGADGRIHGLLGNSGNTDAPHLHFHVMDGPSPLRANGLPYMFTSFVGDGVVTSEAPLWKGAPAPIDAKALSGNHVNQLPLDDQLITFPE